MTTFDDREKAYENQFAHDAEIEFLAHTRRDKLLAYWAAELMGKSPRDAALYARDIIQIDLSTGTDASVRQKLVNDLSGLANQTEIDAKMEELLGYARDMVKAGK